MKVRLLPPDETPEVVLDGLPVSKSVAARAMMLRAVRGLMPEAEGPADECDDLRVLRRGLLSGGRDEIDVEMSGTALRFLTAWLAATPGADAVLTGAERLCQRPVGPLVEALRRMGADIEWLGREGCAPMHIRGRRLAGGTVRLDCSASSQPASALLLVAPLMEQPVEIEPEGAVASAPYLRLTEGMCAIGPDSLADEPDWSAAAFWYEMAALSAGFFTLRGLDTASAQPDAACARLFARLGIDTAPAEDGLGGIDLLPQPDLAPRLTLDLADNPDLAQPLAVTAAMLRVPFRLTGLSTLRLKECDRIAALVEELGRLGFVVDAGPDWLEWEGVTMPIAEIPAFDAHGDHRMAMALAPVALYVPGITIDGAETVAKSYPRFWEHLQSIGFTVDDVTAG